MRRRFLGAVVAGGLFVLLAPMQACTQSAPGDKTQVVTTSNIVADWVRTIGGERVAVFTLLQPGTDPHTFQPGAADVARVAGADIIFAVGLGLEGSWLSRLLENAAADQSRVVALGENVNPMSGENGKDGGHGLFNAHFWWDPLRVKTAVDEITRHLVETDPAGTSIYARNQADYKQELDRLHARTTERLGAIPQERRKLVTSHETMDYFASRYGFEAVGAVIPGVSTEREPSAAELTTLAATMHRLGVTAVFSETTVSDRMALAIAGETGARIVRLYSDSVGPPGSPADTYVKMMDYNVEAILQALR